MARLRELRLAKEAADRAAEGTAAKPASKKRRPRKALRPDSPIVQLLQNDESPVISDRAWSALVSVHP
jgi:hypothetical protein